MSRPLREAGFSYGEVLVATFLLGVALVPALDALNAGTGASAVHEQRAVLHHHLYGKLEEVLAKPFAELDAAALAAGSGSVASAYSDPVGIQDRRVVYLARYDGDEADADGNRLTGGDEGLLWVRVEIPGTNLAIESLTTR